MWIIGLYLEIWDAGDGDFGGRSRAFGEAACDFYAADGFACRKVCRFVDAAAPLLEQANKKRLSRRIRQRAVGAGKRYDLPVCDRLLMTLIYYRTYITQEFLGCLFDMDASNVCRNMQIIRPVLAQIFRIPERRIVMTPEAVTTLFLTPLNSGSTGRKAA